MRVRRCLFKLLLLRSSTIVYFLVKCAFSVEK